MLPPNHKSSGTQYDLYGGLTRESMTVFWKCISLLTVTGAVCIFIVSGCVSTVRYTPFDYCSQPVNSLMARIVLTREYAVFAGGPVRISDNDQPIGEIGTRDRLCWDRFPGQALIVGFQPSERGDVWKIEINTKANGIYYLHGDSSLSGRYLKLLSNPE